MAYNEGMARRIRSELEGLPGLTEKNMFGGVAFMLQGNMACGVNKDDMIVRVGPERHEEALSDPLARPFDLTGKPMAGWVTVSAAVLEDEQAFREWVRWGVDYAMSLPPK
jgi:TfoX/Sxy family transcriptional regulator of competence genes